LHELRDGECAGEQIYNNIDFLKDPLFCEWAYFLDFDKKRLQILRGRHDWNEMEMVGEPTFETLRSRGFEYMDEVQSKVDEDDE